jgi:hypothetical protein
MSTYKQRIFKYPLEPDAKFMLQMPKNARILSLVNQGGLPFLYALVDEDQPIEPRVFRATTTGDVFNPEILEFIGTLQLGGEKEGQEWYALHLFEVETALRPMHPDPVSNRFEADRQELKREIHEEDDEFLQGVGFLKRVLGSEDNKDERITNAE